jgi:hypothetical protein
MKYADNDSETAEVLVLNSAAIREKAGRYMSTANGVTTLRAPSRRTINQLGGRELAAAAGLD